MIQDFKNKVAESIYHGFDTKVARQIPRELWNVAARKLDMLDAAKNIQDLKVPPGNRLERLRADYRGKYSIRINQQYRIVFRFDNGHAYEVEILDYH